jgi:hypothetical protein
MNQIFFWKETDLVIPLDIRRIVRNSVCYPEIDQLELSAYQHEIGRLQIRMDDLLLMYHMHRLQHLHYPPQRENEKRNINNVNDQPTLS